MLIVIPPVACYYTDVADNFPLSAFIGANDDDDVGSDLAEADEDASDVAAVDAELLQQLREHIREDEDIAAKSAMLLKLLDVCGELN